MTTVVKIDGEAIDLAEFVRILKLSGQFEERLVQPEMHASNVEINRVPLCSLHSDGERVIVAHMAKEIVGNKVPVNIRNHFAGLRSLQHRPLGSRFRTRVP